MSNQKVGVPRWDVNDALRIVSRFADWLSTGDAMRLSRGHVWSQVREQLPDEEDAAALAKESNAALAESIRATPPIWCEPPMVDLLSVAAAEMPAGELEPWCLPSPTSGIVVFAKPLPADWNDVYDFATGLHAAYHDEIVAITWEKPFTNRWVVRSWSRNSSPSGTYRLSDVGKIRCPDLRPSAVVEVVGDKVLGGDATRVLVALTALSRTSRTVGESQETASKAARRAARKAGMVEPTVRRLYLHRPETGAAELDALRAQRQGSPRGHWVRGHWRRQWHASIEEHRWQWIEGFPRGDFSKGAVPGQRIQVARRPSPVENRSPTRKTSLSSQQP